MRHPIPAHAATILYRVPYADTDMMGVVYYGNYLTLFERCRNELMRPTGTNYKALEASGFMLPVIEAHVEYKSPAKYDDEIKITAWVAEAKGFRCKICCLIERDDEVLATGHTVHCCVAASTRRPARLPQHILDFVAKTPAE